MRTFIAIDLDRNIKNNLSNFLQELDTGNKSIRWIKPSAMHLTLKFLGEIGEEKRKEVESVLEKTAKESSPFLLRLKGTGTFPPGKKFPRVIWIGIEESQALREIQAKLEQELEKIHFPKEQRKFHPHLTLGRVKAHYNLEHILLMLAQNKEKEFGEMTSKKISLFLSTLKPTGAEYTILSEFELR